MSYIITIGIPTYNRASFLERCLDSFIFQLKGLEDKVELLVSDNASTDNTGDIVSKYAKLFPIKYIRNEVNKGSDFNIAHLFDKATGKYVWIFGDDDFVLPNAVSRIFELLSASDYGVIYVSGLDSIDTQKAESTQFSPLVYKVYNTPISFVERVSYYMTFITGNIINKSILAEDIDFYEFTDTYLTQINWTVKAVFAANENAVVETPLIACEQDNSGGYNYIKVFSANYNYIMHSLVEKNYNIDKRFIYITNVKLINTHLPIFVYKILYSSNKYLKEDGLKMLFNCFWKYPGFWTNILPIYIKYWIRINLLRKIGIFR